MISATKLFAVIAFAAMLLNNSAVAQTNSASTQGTSGAHELNPRDTAVGIQPARLPMSQPEPGAATKPEVLLDTGDLLEVSVYGAPDFDKRQVRVSATGDIVLPFIDAQHVEGLTLAQAQALIARNLAAGQFFNDPQVFIFVQESSTQDVSVLGEVQRPGRYPLVGSRRLFDAISLAGGLAPKAGKVVTIIHRVNPMNAIKITLGNDVQGSSEGNVEILPSDTIVVSKAGIVYVVGDVRLPGGFVMENGGLTVLQALALAQGANSTAALDSARLIRTVNAKRQEVPIPLKRILASKSPDLRLEPEDIVFVPNSVGKSAARRSLEAAVQTATGVAIYRR
jgi:polysaccharide biosynthesis/export protein